MAKGEILPRYILSVPVTIAYLEFPSLIWGAQERAAKAAVGGRGSGDEAELGIGTFLVFVLFVIYLQYVIEATLQMLLPAS